MAEKTHCQFIGKHVKIYALADEIGNVFYIGCTFSRLEQRLAQHLSEAKNDRKYVNRRKTAIIRKLNFNITATIIDMAWITGESKSCLKYRARTVEKTWIDKYRALGYELCNGRLPFAKKPIQVHPEFIGKTIRVSSDGKNPDKPVLKMEVLEKEVAINSAAS